MSADVVFVIAVKMQFNLDSDGSDVICVRLVKVLHKVYGDASQSRTAQPS